MGRFKERYYKLKQQGLCVICGLVLADAGVRCEACAAQHSSQQNHRDNVRFYRNRKKRAARTVERIEEMLNLTRRIAELGRRKNQAA